MPSSPVTFQQLLDSSRLVWNILVSPSSLHLVASLHLEPSRFTRENFEIILDHSGSISIYYIRVPKFQELHLRRCVESLMPELLKKRDYDVTILGTGLAASILAASISITGRSVLHLDPQPFYGSTTATLPLRDWDTLVLESEGSFSDQWQVDETSKYESLENVGQLLREYCSENAKFVPVNTNSLREAVFPYGVRIWPVTVKSEDFEKAKAYIYLDVDPRGLYAAGRMVSLLERTSVGHYVNFKTLEAIYVDFKDEGLRKVPASRSDVFQSKYITMVEKRLLMRFLKQALDEEEDENEEYSEFEESMKAEGLTDKLRTMVRHALAFSSGDSCTSRKKGRESLTLFQQSLVKFKTPTPFLWTNYGSGDLSQAFCRLCAVNGGVYVLGRGIKGVVTEEDMRTRVVTSENELVQTRYLFVESQLVETPIKENKGCIWRFAAVIDRSIRGDYGRLMIIVPRGNADNQNSTVHIRQFDHSTMICPPSFYIVYAETLDEQGTEEDLVAAISRYIRVDEGQEEGLPQILWAVSYEAVAGDSASPDLESPDVRCIKRPEPDSTCGSVISEAERCFVLCRDDHALRFFPPKDMQLLESGMEQLAGASDG